MYRLRYSYGDFALAVAGMSIVFDVTVLCFPLVIKNLQMKKKRKFMVASIFWLGAFYAYGQLTPHPDMKQLRTFTDDVHLNL